MRDGGKDTSAVKGGHEQNPDTPGQYLGGGGRRNPCTADWVGGATMVTGEENTVRSERELVWGGNESGEGLRREQGLGCPNGEGGVSGPGAEGKGRGWRGGCDNEMIDGQKDTGSRIKRGSAPG